MGLMIDAYKTAAESFKERVEQDKEAYKRLLTQDPVVVRGCYDHTERVLDVLGLSFKAVPPAELSTLELSSDQPLFINCPGELPPESIRWLRNWVETDGGCVVTTDWALPNCVQKAFPGYVEHNGRSTTDDVVSVSVAPEGKAMLGDLIEADDDPRWWLEGSSHPIRVLDSNRVEVLIESDEMKSKYGESPIAVRFFPGNGTVYHMVSHAYLQRTKANSEKQVAGAAEFLTKKGIVGDAAATLKIDQTVGELEAAYLSVGLLGRIVSEYRKKSK